MLPGSALASSHDTFLLLTYRSRCDLGFIVAGGAKLLVLWGDGFNWYFLGKAYGYVQWFLVIHVGFQFQESPQILNSAGVEYVRWAHMALYVTFLCLRTPLEVAGLKLPSSRIQEVPREALQPQAQHSQIFKSTDAEPKEGSLYLLYILFVWPLKFKCLLLPIDFFSYSPLVFFSKVLLFSHVASACFHS